jgi:hypothetical protein
MASSDRPHRMRGLLRIAELRLEVFENIGSWDTPEKESMLLHLSLTCRAWSHMALDILWRDLGSVDPLVPLLNAQWHTGLGDETPLRLLVSSIYFLINPKTDAHKQKCHEPLDWGDGSVSSLIHAALEQFTSTPAFMLIQL